MTIYRNTKFVKRDYEMTNVVFAESFNAGWPPGDHWQDCGEHIPPDIARMPHCTLLWVEREIRYYGYL